MPFGQRIHNVPEQVDVETTAKTPVAGYDDETNALDGAFQRKTVFVFQVSLRYMSDHVAHFLRIGPGLVHAFLSTAHFAGRDHFHRFGDLLSILDTLDLGPNFFSASHCLLSCRNLCGLVRYQLPLVLKSFRAA